MECEVWQTCLCMNSSGNQTPDLMILNPMPSLCIHPHVPMLITKKHSYTKISKVKLSALFTKLFLKDFIIKNAVIEFDFFLCFFLILFCSILFYYFSATFKIVAIWEHYKQLVNIPVEGIRLLDAVCILLGKRRRAWQKTPCAFCSGVVSAWCRLL